MSNQRERSSRTGRENVLKSVLAHVSAEPDRLAEILEQHTEPLIAFTAGRTILVANLAGERFFGYERHQLDGHPTDVIVPERFRQPDAPPQPALADLTTVEIPALRRDNREIPTEWTFGLSPGTKEPIFIMVVGDSAERARREHELEQTFRAVYENALDGIALIDDELRFVDVNPAACRVFRRERDDIIGMSTASIVPPSDHPTTSRIGEFRAAGVMAGESSILLPDGTVRRAEFGAVADVTPGIHLSIFRDIEDRKRAEETQRFLDDVSVLLGASLDYDETLASIARLAVPRVADWAAIDLLEDDGSLRRVAMAHVDPRRMAVASEVRRRQHASGGNPSTVGAVIETGRPQLIEVVTDDMLVAKLGQTPDLLELVRGLGLASCIVVPLSVRGKAKGAISLVYAESHRRYGPTDLPFALELSRRAGYAIENALYVRDLHLAQQVKDLFLRRAEHLQATATKLVRAENVDAIARAFQSDEPPSPVGARGWSLFLRAGDKLELVAATRGARPAALARSSVPIDADTPLSEAAREGKPVWLRNTDDLLARYPGLRKESLRGDVQARAAIPLWAGDESIGALGVLFPVEHAFGTDERDYLIAVANLWAQALHRARLVEAEREAIRRALEAETQLTRRKDEFLAMLGHELRNPLAPIVTATSLLRRRGKTPERELEIIDRQARHMVRLIDDLLDISRITSGKLTLRRDSIDLREVVAQAIESTTPVFDDRQVRLHSDLGPSPIVVNGDRERLVQVFGNVLVNAAKFTPAGKAVFVSGMADGDRGTVHVRDEGRGIEPEMLPRVFELFTQGPQASDRPAGGLGLGLAIAHSIVSAHDGRIEIASDGIDRGAVVTVRLPLLSVARKEEPPTPTVPAAAATEGKRRLLIVDDNEDSATVLAEFLADVGYECHVALDAHGALSLAREVLPDVAIIDIGLPDVDGHELARRMRATLAAHPPKLIALTGYARDSDRALALEAGFIEHLAKPVEMTDLMAKLGAVLAQE